MIKLDEDDRQVKNKNAPFVASVKVLRYQFVAYKLFRVLGLYSGDQMTPERRQEVANEILTVFLQAMEHHPNILSTVGVGAMHSG